MNWKLIFLPVAVVVELANLPLTLVGITHDETGFGNWCLDRKLGDPLGKPWQTRKKAIAEQENEGAKSE